MIGFKQIEFFDHTGNLFGRAASWDLLRTIARQTGGLFTYSGMSALAAAPAALLLHVSSGK
jgi:hypothetical protein